MQKREISAADFDSGAVVLLKVAERSELEPREIARAFAARSAKSTRLTATRALESVNVSTEQLAAFHRVCELIVRRKVFVTHYACGIGFWDFEDHT